MEEATLTVRIYPDGTRKILVNGVEGTDCVEFAKAFEDALGADKSTMEFTQEYYKKRRDRSVLIREEI